MICARCDQPIRRDEDYLRVDHDRPTGPSITTYVHKRRCQAASQQTYPARRFGA